MDECWSWRPTINGEIEQTWRRDIDMPEAMFSRYQQLSKEWTEFQEQLEHMYRQQEGLKPFNGSPYKKEKQNVKAKSEG